jgi:hypothetical protein
MSYKKFDNWSKRLADGRVIEYHYATWFLSNGRTKSFASAKISGVAIEPIQNLAAGLPHSEVEALLEKSIMASASKST